MNKYMPWVCAALLVSVTFGTIYAAVQQDLRQAANDPQTQLAEDAASQLNLGASPASLMINRVDMVNSLAPFIIVYDRSGHVIAGSGYVGATIPTIPLGVLRHSTLGQDHAITWQPAGNIRIASVTVKANNYYVVGGRSLRLVEQHEDQALFLVAFGWLLAMLMLTAWGLAQIPVKKASK